MRARLSLAIASLATVLLWPGGASPAADIVGIAKFRETQVSHRLIGDGAGRTEVWRTRVYTMKGTFVGTGVLTCVYIDHHTSFRQCIGTYTLPLGSIVVAGTFASRAAYEMLVLTGSRFYATADGTMIARRYARVPPQSFLTFYLTR